MRSTTLLAYVIKNCTLFDFSDLMDLNIICEANNRLQFTHIINVVDAQKIELCEDKKFVLKKSADMKGFIWIAMLFCLFGNSYADEFLLFTGEAYTYNDVFKNLSETQYAFKYNDEEELFYLVTADIFNKAWILLTEEHLETMRNTLKKYTEWEKTASEKKVQIEKEIPDSAIATKVIWKFGEDWYSASNLLLSFIFLSQTDTRHQIVIRTNKVESLRNEFIDYKLDTLYLEKANVLDLIKRISVEGIQRAIQEIGRKKEVENLFH